MHPAKAAPQSPARRLQRQNYVFFSLVRTNKRNSMRTALGGLTQMIFKRYTPSGIISNTKSTPSAQSANALSASTMLLTPRQLPAESVSS